ncbi:hypothetical protein JCM5353_006327 [Sporobolomyces roseus]
MTELAPAPPQESHHASTTSTSGISEDEARLYDRQLRLWGVEAQNRMRSSHILLCGQFRGISTEVAKNIVLAGVGRVTLLDQGEVSWEDLGSGYWLREEDIGKKRVECAASRLQLLNPRVQISTHTDRQLLEDESFLNNFDLVVLVDQDANTILKLNTLTRKLQIKFFASGSIGIHGYVFSDLLSHSYIIDQQKVVNPGEAPTVVPLKIEKEYCSFQDAIKHDFSTAGSGGKKLRKKLWKKREILWSVLTLFDEQLNSDSSSSSSTTSRPTFEALRSRSNELLPRLSISPSDLTDEVLTRFTSMIGHEFASSCAIVGGVLGQDVLNCVGGKEEPVRNLMVFDGDLGEGGVWALGC